jgi:hypothetical protein
MDESNEPGLTCEKCGGGVSDDDASCPNCGSLFTDLYVCSRHPSIGATGVCVICSQPFCSECGKIRGKIFLCDAHAAYVVREGMVRLFRTRGTLESQLATSSLSQAGLHPFTIADLEVFVPISEIRQAESVLKEIGLVTNERS